MRSQPRAGFTLIELMVAMALTLLIMAILSQAFVMALDTFTGLKGIGDMQQLLRTAKTQFLADLGNYHLEGARRLSDPNIAAPSAKIQSGFFVARQGSAVSASAGAPWFAEGIDQNAVPSYRATDHLLYFTTKRMGNRQEDFFTASLTDPVAGPRNSLSIFFQDPAGIASASEVGNVVTITTAQNHIFLPGNTVTIGIPGPANAGYNGRFVITSTPSATTFTYNNPIAGLPSAGGGNATVGGSTAYAVTPFNLQTQTLTLPHFAGTNQSYYSSQWAEVLYYLEPTGTTEEPNLPTSTVGTPLFALKRALFVMVPDSSILNGTGLLNAQIDNAGFPAFRNLACNMNPLPPNRLLFYCPIDGAQGQRTIIDPATFSPADPRLAGVATLMLPNVISFEVQMLPASVAAFPDPPLFVGYYDTTRFNSAGYTNNFGLRAVQITLRIWDTKTRQTRQMTIVQDL